MRQKSKNLVCQYLEKLSRAVLEEHEEKLRKYVRNRNGVYALYSQNKLYYVGLATNLRSRLKHHLKDRHAETWDNFSVYFTIGDQHLRELEALVLRIAIPGGNRQKGKLRYADNLKKGFLKDVKVYQENERNQMFRDGKPCKQPEKQRASIDRSKAILAQYINKRIHIRFRYQGNLYIAHVRKDGTIAFAGDSANAKKFQNKIYYTPTAAAKAVTRHTMNGWRTWKYERAPGDWIPLDELRRK